MNALIRSSSIPAAAAALFVALSVPMLGAPAQAPTNAPTTFNEGDVIPVESIVREGKLPNGLTYIIKPNPRPAKRVSLRLAIKAGSIQEADDQQGLAHFIEHMAFNGSEHFKPGEVFSYFESVGAQLGPHVNAQTGFDQTIYKLDLPTDNPDVLAKGFTALADFAGGLTFDPAQVDKERGVVIEEWRGRLGAGSRISDAQIPVLFYRSRYAERVPIGKPDIIQNAPASRLRAFYDAWYRPELMGVVVVGDVNVQQMETAIRSTFGPLKARGPAGKPVDTSVPLMRDLMTKVTADPEVTDTSLQLIAKRPKEREDRVGDYRRQLIERLFFSMFDDRFGELAQRNDAKFLGAGVGGGPLGKDVDTFELDVTTKDGALPEGLAAVAVEAKRVRQFGFTPGELERAKRSLLAFYERAYNERDTSESGMFADEMLRHFLTDEPIPGIAYEYRLVQWALPTITLKDVSDMAQARLSDDSRVMLVVVPQKQGLDAPTESELKAALDAGERVAVLPWNDNTTDRALLETLPNPGTIQSRRELPNLGVTVVQFGNGVEAWLKPTDFKTDQIIFTMYAKGGASLAPPEDFLQASLATQYVAISGFGGLKPLDRTKLLAGRPANAMPFVSLSTHGIQGSASPAELETALQLLYVDFVLPEDDPSALTLIKRQLDAAVANRGQNPDDVFGERLAAINSNDHYTSKPLTAEGVASLDSAKMYSFYKARFSNAADFTLFMVGSFKIDTALPLLARYVGSLPSTGKRTSDFKDVGIKFPTAIVRDTVVKGREPSAQAVLSFAADVPPDAMEQERMLAATMVVENTLRDVLREDLGQTYGVGVGLSQSTPQRGDGNVEVNFTAAPQNIQSMTERVLQEVKRLQDQGPSADLVDKAKETARRQYETSMKENGYWMGRLQRIHLLGGDPGELLTRPQRIDSITPTIVRDTIRKYFPLDRYTMLTLLPETAAAVPAAAGAAR
ncbi:MAG TPA: insulinase family protein [Vicinamibacterales bacterium]|nr:insulinase family protein [Vicinamibacterales bacterium]